METAFVVSDASKKVMRAHGAKQAKRPVMPRVTTTSAFDHDVVNPRGPITQNSDRVLLCPPEKPCKVCRARAVFDAAHL